MIQPLTQGGRAVNQVAQSSCTALSVQHQLFTTLSSLANQFACLHSKQVRSSCQGFKPLLANSSRPELLISTVTMHITSCNRIECRTVQLNGLSDKRSHVNSLKAELVTAKCLMCKQLAVSCLSGRPLCEQFGDQTGRI